MSKIYVVTCWTKGETIIQEAFTRKEFAEAAIEQKRYDADLEEAKARDFSSVLAWKRSEEYFHMSEYITWTIDEIDVVM